MSFRAERRISVFTVRCYEMRFSAAPGMTADDSGRIHHLYYITTKYLSVSFSFPRRTRE